MKYITVTHKQSGISFVADVNAHQLDEYMERLQTILRPGCKFVVSDVKFINHWTSAHPRKWEKK